jgi:hypothetical protein
MPNRPMEMMLPSFGNYRFLPTARRHYKHLESYGTTNLYRSVNRSQSAALRFEKNPQ